MARNTDATNDVHAIPNEEIDHQLRSFPTPAGTLLNPVPTRPTAEHTMAPSRQQFAKWHEEANVLNKTGAESCNVLQRFVTFLAKIAIATGGLGNVS
jgi:hypothetical protein